MDEPESVILYVYFCEKCSTMIEIPITKGPKLCEKCLLTKGSSNKCLLTSSSNKCKFRCIEITNPED